MPRKIKKIETEIFFDIEKSADKFQNNVNIVYCEIVRQRLQGVQISTEEKMKILASLSTHYIG